MCVKPKLSASRTVKGVPARSTEVRACWSLNSFSRSQSHPNCRQAEVEA
jgi:hypothetical protein